MKYRNLATSVAPTVLLAFVAPVIAGIITSEKLQEKSRPLVLIMALCFVFGSTVWINLAMKQWQSYFSDPNLNMSAKAVIFVGGIAAMAVAGICAAYKINRYVNGLM